MSYTTPECVAITQEDFRQAVLPLLLNKQ